MYNERKDSFSIKDIVVQILCILLFVFLLLWLFPTKGFIKNNLNNNGYLADNEQIVDTIFNYNVQSMKEAAIGYYTTSRLPINVGDTDIMTLRDMLNEKLILSFLDSNNKQCDLDNSYVQITKGTDEYTLKVNLICPASKSDYILVHLGCYDYCKGNVCEKKTTTPSKSKSNVKVNVNNTNKVEVNTQSNTNVNQNISNDINVNANNSNVNIDITNNNSTVINQDNRTIVSNPVPPVISMTRYKYSKEIRTCGAWSEYTTTKINPTSTIEVETKIVNELVGTEENSESVTPYCASSSATLINSNRSCKITNSSLVVKNGTCPSGYNYSSTYGCVSNSGVAATEVWSTPKRVVYSSAKTSTASTIYTYVSVSYGVDSCDGCKYSINYIYDVKSLSYQCPSGNYMMSGTKCYAITNATYDYSCSNSNYTYVNGTCEYTTDSICPSGYVKSPKGKLCVKTTSSSKYEDVLYYRSRTCETTYVYDTSYSSNDTTLISQGYKYIGIE